VRDESPLRRNRLVTADAVPPPLDQQDQLCLERHERTLQWPCEEGGLAVGHEVVRDDDRVVDLELHRRTDETIANDVVVEAWWQAFATA
jgi:hypothetical protein